MKIAYKYALHITKNLVFFALIFREGSCHNGKFAFLKSACNFLWLNKRKYLTTRMSSLQGLPRARDSRSKNKDLVSAIRNRFLQSVIAVCFVVTTESATSLMFVNCFLYKLFILPKIYLCPPGAFQVVQKTPEAFQVVQKTDYLREVVCAFLQPNQSHANLSDFLSLH